MKTIKFHNHALHIRLSKRVIMVKGIVTLTFLAYWLNHEAALPVAILGNFIWLWFDTNDDVVQQDDIELLRQEVAALKEKVSS